jgi:hypothetical protein
MIINKIWKNFKLFKEMRIKLIINFSI